MASYEEEEGPIAEGLDDMVGNHCEPLEVASLHAHKLLNMQELAHLQEHSHVYDEHQALEELVGKEHHIH